MELFKQRVKTQGAVVTADMITPEMKSEYHYLQTGTLLDKTPKEWPLGEYVNAAKTLLSYQLRDDGVLSYGHLTKKDFVPEALERSTKVDWDLLKRVISLVKEVS